MGEQQKVKQDTSYKVTKLEFNMLLYKLIWKAALILDRPIDAISNQLYNTFLIVMYRLYNISPIFKKIQFTASG